MAEPFSFLPLRTPAPPLPASTKPLLGSCPFAAKLFILLLLFCAVAEAQVTTPISALEVQYRKQIYKTRQFSVYLLELHAAGFFDLLLVPGQRRIWWGDDAGFELHLSVGGQ